MIDLLLDSSNRELSIGIAKDGILIDDISYEAWQRQSELMIPELDKMIHKHSIDRTMINSVVVGIGPGSYTGVRISLTIAKVIANTLNIPLYTISSLQMLRDGEKPSICLINARSNRSYIGSYQNDLVILKDSVMKNEEVLEYISQHKDYSICGDVAYLGLEGKKAMSFRRC